MTRAALTGAACALLLAIVVLLTRGRTLRGIALGAAAVVCAVGAVARREDDAPLMPTEGSRWVRFGPWGSEVVVFVKRWCPPHIRVPEGVEVWEDEHGRRFHAPLTPEHWRRA